MLDGHPCTGVPERVTKTSVNCYLITTRDVNIQDKDGCTPLHRCTIGDNENLCRLLLEHNADVSIQDNAECAPLHWCAREGNENLCRLLLEQNADVNIQEKHGFTPLH